jgi:hypothetical protein
MNITDLTAFCKSWGDLSLPFHLNNFVYATDGSLAIRIPVENFEGPLPENGNRKVASYAEKLDSYFTADLSVLESHVLSDFDFEQGTEICTHCEGEGRLYACNECNGSGEVPYSTDYHDYENECLSCNGGGYFSKSQWEDEFRRSDISYADTEECEECGGTGVQFENPDIYIGGLRFQGKLLKKFIQFEGAVVFITPLTDISSIPGYTSLKPALIKWEKGEGILMPMRDLA